MIGTLDPVKLQLHRNAIALTSLSYSLVGAACLNKLPPALQPCLGLSCIEAAISQRANGQSLLGGSVGASGALSLGAKVGTRHGCRRYSC